MVAIGIDLGTTNSVVASLNESKKPELIPSRQGGTITPSVVFYESEDHVVVGEHAKNSALAFPDRTVQMAKNHLDTSKTWQIFGQARTPMGVSAIILTKLVEEAEAALGDKVTSAVVTVPAVFSEGQSNETKEAAILAGIENVKLLQEPVAAALFYGLQGGDDAESKTVLVCDLGGGTFDVTIMRIETGQVRMLVTGGDRRLGGADWDQALVEHVAQAFIDKHDSDPRESATSNVSLVQQVEWAKRALSDRRSHTVTITHDGHTENIELTREDFELLTENQLARMVQRVEQAFADGVKHGIDGVGDIDQTILVGGSSRMPQVARAIQELTGHEPRLLDPDHAVAKGAALYSEMSLFIEHADDPETLSEHGLSPADAGLLPQASVERVCSFALGTKLVVDRANPDVHYNEVLIPVNTPLPAKNEVTAGTVHHGQQRIRITVLEGDSIDVDDCVEIGDGLISGIPPGLPVGSDVRIEFELTEESLLRVHAVELTHNTECRFELSRATGLSPATVEAESEALAGQRIE